MSDAALLRAVEVAFGFLTTEHGFEEPGVQRDGVLDDGAARYVSVHYQCRRPGAERYVTVGAAIWRLEFDVVLGPGLLPQARREDGISLRDLLDLEAPEYRHPVPVPLEDARSDPALMTEHIEACALALRTHGDRIFSGAPELWSEAKQLREQRRAAAAAAKRDADLRRDAVAAFRAGEWQRTLTLLGAITGGLTAVDRKRAEVARKRLVEGR